MPYGTPTLLEYSDGNVAVLYPVPRAKVNLLEQLWRRLHEAWIEWGLDTRLLVRDKRHSKLIDAIAALIPCDRVLPLSTKELKRDIPVFEEWFLGKYQDGSVDLPRIIKLQMFVPVPRKDRTRKEDAPVTVKDLPYPTSGNNDCDTLSSLIHGFNEFGIWMWENLPGESLDKIQYTIGELSRPGDERVSEYINELFAKELESEDYRQSMFEEW